jgi:hypothetical protein
MLLDLIAIAARIGSWRETAHRSVQAIATSTRVTATGLDTCGITCVADGQNYANRQPGDPLSQVNASPAYDPCKRGHPAGPEQGDDMVADLGESIASQVPQFGEVVLPAQALAGVADRQFGHVVVDAAVCHQRAHGAAQVVQAEVDAAGPKHGRGIFSTHVVN